jgi:hypothetical protein
MSVQKIIKESMEKNPLKLKEALQEELKTRMALALEAKMKEMEDEDEDEDELEEAAKTVDDFMNLMKIKSEPRSGTRMIFGGYPFDYDGYEDGEVYLAAVDKEAAKGLTAALKKKGFNAKAKNLDVTVMLGEQVELEEANLMSKADFAKMVAKTTPKTADRYDQNSAVKSAILTTPQKKLATDREFIDSVLDILYNKYGFKA